MTNQTYNHKSIEAKWQELWLNNKAFEFNNKQAKKPYYVLEMFPYPSGKIHMGHVRNYAIGDFIARVKKMQGFDVLHPMGFDAFGLPAENAAIEQNSHPQTWTLKNIEDMTATIKKLGFSYDWNRLIATCMPDYYKHEQEMFIKFYNAGLAYQKESFVNWDPVDNTVLANEQVIDGRGWRSGALVERRQLKQWFLKVSNFAEDLLNDLNLLDKWPEKVKTMQKNWIGKSTGAELNFKLKPIAECGFNIYKITKSDAFGAVEFETKNLVARLITKDDFELLYALHSNPEVVKNMGNGLAKTRAEVELQMANILKEPSNRVFVLFEKSSGKFAGRAGISKFGSIVKADIEGDFNELGYCLHQEFWGKKYAREISLALVQMFFDGGINLNFGSKNELYAKATDRNLASIKNLKIIGFSSSQKLKSDGGQHPASLYTLTKDGFNQSLSELKIYTTRPDTLYGASFVALSAFHPLLTKLYPLLVGDVKAFIETQKNTTTSTQELETTEKQGIFTGLYAKNPLNELGENLPDLPIYIANFVLMDYGTGALFACPAHDERDFEFATKYNLPIKEVVFDPAKTASLQKGISVKSGDISLAPLKADDVDFISLLHCDPEVIKYLDGYVKDPASYAKNTEQKCNLIIKAGDEKIGRAGIYRFYNLDGKRHTNKSLLEVAYILSKNKWGKGYGTKVAKMLCNACFTNFGESEVCAVIDSSHKVSEAILVKLGFVKKSDIYVNTEYGQEAYFELTRETFCRLNPEFYIPVKKPFTELGTAINSPLINGLDSNQAKVKIINLLEQQGQGKAVTNYKLRDWGISRQRYWGCPIPMIHCPTCGTVPEDIKNLPVELPFDIDLKTQGSPLANHQSWKHCKCPKCTGHATRETDTFDTFFESSWYFLRFLNPQKDDAAFDKNDAKNFLPVKEYIGGIEHAILHLLYARFFVKALHKIGELDITEPFEKLITQGMICHKTFKHKQSGVWLEPTEAKLLPPELVEIGDSIKMSKSKKNIVDPEFIIEKYGADTARLFVLSDSPPDKDIEWTDDGASACYKFLHRVFNLVSEVGSSVKEFGYDKNLVEKDALIFCNNILQDYYQAFNAITLNKCIAKCRELFNKLNETEPKNHHSRVYLSLELLKLLSPIAPHICEELWVFMQNSLGNKDYGLLCDCLLSDVDNNYLTKSVAKIAVQIGGKLKGVVEAKIDCEQEEVVKIASSINSIKAILDAGNVKKVIFVKNKILNFIV